MQRSPLTFQNNSGFALGFKGLLGELVFRYDHRERKTILFSSDDPYQREWSWGEGINRPLDV